MQTNILFPFSINFNQKVRKISQYTRFGYIKDGQDFIDTGLGNCGSFMLGFDRTDILDTVVEKSKKIPFTSGEFFTTNDDIIELSDKLFEMSNGYRSFYSVSGSDAVEGALKAARLYHQSRKKNSKIKILGITESYHGSTYLSSSVAGGNLMTAILGKSSMCEQIERDENFNILLDNIKTKINEIDENNISCLLIESCSWLGGVFPYPKEFWKSLKVICDESDILLILDDIAMCGGKLGKMFGFEIFPDIFTMGKSFSGGYFPLSATLLSPKIFQEITGNFWSHGFTNSFNMSGIYSSLEYIRILEEENIFKNYESILKKSQLIFETLKQQKLISNYTNNGLYFNLKFNPLEDYTNVEENFFNHGLNVGVENYKWKGLRVIIPLTADDEYFYKIESRLFSSLNRLS